MPGFYAVDVAVPEGVHPLRVRSISRLVMESGSVAAVLGAGATLLSIRNATVGRKIIILRCLVNFEILTTITTTFQMQYAAFIARNFTANDSGGTLIDLSTKPGILDSLDPACDAVIRVASTGTLTPGTRTLDSLGCGLVNFSTGTVVGTRLGSLGADVPSTLSLTSAKPILNKDEGFLITAPKGGPADGTFRFTCELIVAEENL